MEVAIGVGLVVLGAAGASAIARTLGGRAHGVRLAFAVAPAGVLIGTGAALARGWDLVPSAVVGTLLVGVLALTSGLRLAPREPRGRS